MTMAETTQIDSVLHVVLSWPRERQLSLARRVLDHLDETPAMAAPARPLARSVVSVEQIRQMLAEPEDNLDDALSIEELEGCLATDAPPPTDEEVERWLEERRMRKYG